jgi:hypothetical protein
MPQILTTTRRSRWYDTPTWAKHQLGVVEQQAPGGELAHIDGAALLGLWKIIADFGELVVEALAGVLVGGLVEAADELPEDGANLIVGDGVRVEVGLGEGLLRSLKLSMTSRILSLKPSHDAPV